MTPAVRAIRFARVSPAPDPAKPGPRWVADVLLDEHPAPVGRVMQHDQSWTYVLADGTSSGLASTVSRQDLERQVVLYYLGTLPGAKAHEAGPPLPMAM